jgi:hypothetical protein
MNQSLTYDFNQPITLANQSGALVSLCTVQQRTGATDPLGQVDLQDWMIIPSLAEIPCILSVYRPSAPDKAAQMRMPDSFDFSNYRHCLLNGYYPAILQQYQAVVDGIPYEIMAAENDSQFTMTRLALRIYEK